MKDCPTTSLLRDWTHRVRLSANGANDSLLLECVVLRRSLEAGVKPAFPPSLIVQVKALACELPVKLGLPLWRLSIEEIRQHVIAQGLVAEISGATLWRWLSSDALRPWQHRSWIFPRDPNFVAKAGPVLDLYERIWEGVSLGSDDFVMCLDEKTSVQARRRKQPTLPPASNRPTRVEHEYFRDAPGFTWPLGMSIGQRSLDAANSKPELPLSTVSSAKSWAKSLISPLIVSFGSWTTALLTAVRKPQIGCGPSGRTLCSSTLPFTPVGSTRLRSTSPSFSERSLHQTISPR